MGTDGTRKFITKGALLNGEVISEPQIDEVMLAIPRPGHQRRTGGGHFQEAERPSAIPDDGGDGHRILHRRVRPRDEARVGVIAVDPSVIPLGTGVCPRPTTAAPGLRIRRRLGYGRVDQGEHDRRYVTHRDVAIQFGVRKFKYTSRNSAGNFAKAFF